MALPSGQDLRTLEQQSRKIGSHIRNEDLLGAWNLEQVWGKKDPESSAPNGAILRALKATLQIRASEGQDLEVSNSVELLGIKLRFCGPGRLVQKRPLLYFQFHHLHMDLAGRNLLSFPLPPTSSRREPFFALIAREQTDLGIHWLAARGRGGGLALWVRENPMKA
jgi:hypothetical protein